MNKSYDRARQLLDQLGTHVSRPKHQPEAPPQNGTCSKCSACIVWATAPSGTRVHLDYHPDGDLVLVAGNAVAFGPARAGLRRFVLHFAACRTATEKKP